MPIPPEGEPRRREAGGGGVRVEPGCRRRDRVGIVGRAGDGAERDQRTECPQAVAGKAAGIVPAAHRQLRAENQPCDRAGRSKHEQRQQAGGDRISRVSKIGELEDHEHGDKTRHRTGHPAGNLAQILQMFPDDLSDACCEAGCRMDSPLLSARAGTSFIAFGARL
jgi:hypothetical protein